jgi:hypothetical protein
MLITGFARTRFRLAREARRRSAHHSLEAAKGEAYRLGVYATELLIGAALCLRWAGLNDACALHQTLKVCRSIRKTRMLCGMRNQNKADLPSLSKRPGWGRNDSTWQARQWCAARLAAAWCLTGSSSWAGTPASSIGAARRTVLLMRAKLGWENDATPSRVWNTYELLSTDRNSPGGGGDGGETERSMGAMRYAVLPSARWLLRHAGAAQDTPSEQTERLVRVVEPLLVGVYQVLWLYPAYVVSFVVNCMWYQDIAAAAYAVGHPALPKPQPRRSGVGKVLGEELFRVTLFAVFLVQVR